MAGVPFVTSVLASEPLVGEGGKMGLVTEVVVRVVGDEVGVDCGPWLSVPGVPFGTTVPNSEPLVGEGGRMGLVTVAVMRVVDEEVRVTGQTVVETGTIIVLTGQSLMPGPHP